MKIYALFFLFMIMAIWVTVRWIPKFVNSLPRVRKNFFSRLTVAYLLMIPALAVLTGVAYRGATILVLTLTGQQYYVVPDGEGRVIFVSLFTGVIIAIAMGPSSVNLPDETNVIRPLPTRWRVGIPAGVLALLFLSWLWAIGPFPNSQVCRSEGMGGRTVCQCAGLETPYYGGCRFTEFPYLTDHGISDCGVVSYCIGIIRGHSDVPW